MNKKLLKVFGIILGLVTIVLAISVFSQSVGYSEGSYSYGGDAYTGIQNAAAQTANNVKYVGQMIRFALGSHMLVLGLAMLLGSLCIRTKKEAPAAMQAPVAAPQSAPMAAPQAPVFTAPVPVQPPVMQPVSGWTCGNCGTANEADSRFCQNCGTPRQ